MSYAVPPPLLDLAPFDLRRGLDFPPLPLFLRGVARELSSGAGDRPAGSSSASEGSVGAGAAAGS